VPRLRCADGAVFGACAGNAGLAACEVEVIPLESESLTKPHARASEAEEERIEGAVLPLGCREKRIKLRSGERLSSWRASFDGASRSFRPSLSAGLTRRMPSSTAAFSIARRVA